MRLTLILLLFSPRETEVVNHDIWSKITVKLAAMADFPVDTRAAARMIIDRAFNMSVSPQEYFDNCKASWIAIAFTSDEMVILLREMGPLATPAINFRSSRSVDDLFFRFKASWPLTYAILQEKKEEFDIMFGKMDKKSLAFVRNTVHDLLELIVKSSQLINGESDYPLMGRFVKKTATNYRNLSDASKRSLEIATCWNSHLMMRDARHGLWHILASSIPYAHLSYGHRSEL